MMFRPRVGATALALASVVALAGCSDEKTGARYAQCVEPMAAERPPALPDDLPLIDAAELTDVTRQKGFLAVSGVASDMTVDDLYDPMVNRVRDEGFDILAQENEGFEAEVYFSRRTEIAGIASLRRGPCPEQVTVSVIYDPLETNAAKKITAKTRRAARG
jgi:hypothetical protein